MFFSIPKQYLHCNGFSLQPAPQRGAIGPDSRRTDGSVPLAQCCGVECMTLVPMGRLWAVEGAAIRTRWGVGVPFLFSFLGIGAVFPPLIL